MLLCSLCCWLQPPLLLLLLLLLLWAALLLLRSSMQLHEGWEERAGRCHLSGRAGMCCIAQVHARPILAHSKHCRIWSAVV